MAPGFFKDMFYSLARDIEETFNQDEVLEDKEKEYLSNLSDLRSMVASEFPNNLQALELMDEMKAAIENNAQMLSSRMK